MFYKWQERVVSVLIGVGMSWIISQPSLSAVLTDGPLLSESLCLEVLAGAFEEGRINRSVSEEDRKALIQCQRKFYPSVSNASLPTAFQCIATMQTIFQEGLGKLLSLNLSDLNLSEAQLRSLKKCTGVVKAYSIPSGSMMPTLEINDRIIVDQTAYRTRSPQRGDIVVFQPTEILRKQSFKDVFIKRVIGLPGETVEVKNGSVYINSKPVAESYLQERPEYQWGPIVVPMKSYFVLGDTRNNSYDSHYWGFVPSDLIVGKIVWRYYPFDRVGSLSQ